MLSTVIKIFLNNEEDVNCDFNSCVMLDSGCSAGRSSITLAKQNSKCIVVSVDRSLSKLNLSTYFLDSKIKSDGNVCFDQDQLIVKITMNTILMLTHNHHLF